MYTLLYKSNVSCKIRNKVLSNPIQSKSLSRIQQDHTAPSHHGPPAGKTISASTLRAIFHRATQVAGLADKNYTPHSLQWGEHLSAFRSESRWSTSRSTALGLPRQSTGTCCSTRPSRPQWLTHFSRLSLDPRVRTPMAPSPVLPRDTQIQTFKAPGPGPAAVPPPQLITKLLCFILAPQQGPNIARLGTTSLWPPHKLLCFILQNRFRTRLALTVLISQVSPRLSPP